jgi:hypothetical protein
VTFFVAEHKLFLKVRKKKLLKKIIAVVYEAKLQILIKKSKKTLVEVLKNLAVKQFYRKIF